ncbi:hypothetical protein PENTCL1PPCAC_29977, partial [Pristionchus entomophagus]
VSKWKERCRASPQLNEKEREILRWTMDTLREDVRYFESKKGHCPIRMAEPKKNLVIFGESVGTLERANNSMRANSQSSSSSSSRHGSFDDNQNSLHSSDQDVSVNDDDVVDESSRDSSSHNNDADEESVGDRSEARSQDGSTDDSDIAFVGQMPVRYHHLEELRRRMNGAMRWSVEDDEGDQEEIGSSSRSSSPDRDPPCYADSLLEDREEHWENDGRVQTIFERIFKEKFLAGVHQVTSPDLSDYDIKSIEHRLHSIGFRNTHKTDKTRAEKYIINGFPFYTPEPYMLIGTKQDLYGKLRFFDAVKEEMNGRKRKVAGGIAGESLTDIPAVPDYEFIRTNEYFHDYGNDHRSKAKICDYKCTCDPEYGCLPETCECMLQSALTADNRVDETKVKPVQIVECCEKCPCRHRPDKCKSVVRYRHVYFHAVRLNTMGFALRTMEPIQRGEPIIEFVGVRTAYVSKDEENWACNTANCKDPKDRKFTGIDDPTTEFCINPMRKGNASRMICHSYYPNVGFINVYRGGILTVDPDLVVFAMEPIEAGDLLYLNYGTDFGIKKDQCKCTQELCHNPKITKWMHKLTWEQGVQVLVEREKKKRARMVQREQEAMASMLPRERHIKEEKENIMQ